MAALLLLCLIVCTTLAPSWGITSVLAWDTQICGQSTCRLGASVRSTLISDASEHIILQHPSRSDVVFDLSIRPQFKRIGVVFNFHRNFTNMYEHHDNELLNCMYSNSQSASSPCQAEQSLCCLTQTERAPGQYCLRADETQSYATYHIQSIVFTAALEINVTLVNTNNSAVVQISSTSNNIEHNALSAQLFAYESVPVSSFATVAQTLLLFVPRDSARDWFVVDNSSAIFPRLSLSQEDWLREVSCLQPEQYLTATQRTDPRDQYLLLRDERWEHYYSAVDSNSAVTLQDTLFRSMYLEYTASVSYQLTMLLYYD